MPVRIVVSGSTAARDAADLAAEIGSQSRLSQPPPGDKNVVEVVTAIVTLAGSVVAIADTVFKWAERLRKRDEPGPPPPRVIVVFDRTGSRHPLEDLSPDEFDHLLELEREADAEADPGSPPGPGTAD
ncbi:hypothetical protein Aph01nite_65890 [Acrocarpospora phusangensis]|uniref:Uncharacterized protein n=1 Tax=Acrocarpospora phusangensis TaxID=1070424 RepID=A0A919UNV6_9ACTN|nr:hypothetical protein [Acrocarpospora phusangensis]GIH28279.1 hypothetical protein Aph01nite_65890 [Acrocarpospora phusangensis]